MEERNGGGRNIGRGMEFVARRYNHERVGTSGGRILKKVYYPLFDRIDLPFGKSMKERAVNDLELIRNYFGEELASGTNIVERFGKWYISQPDYGDKRLSNNTDCLELIKPQLGQIFDRNDQMARDTGFILDMFGVEFWSELGKYIKDPDYWSLDSFRVTDNNGQPELRLVDTGLLWSRLDLPSQPQHINIHELPAGWTAVNLLIPAVRKRMGIEVTNPSL